ncbi:MAG: hypothetical protein ACK42C_05255, partial [Aquificaceae bacterium]
MRKIPFILLSVLGAFLLLSLAVVLILSANLPPVEALRSWKPPLATVVYDAKDRPFGDVAVQRRYYVSLEDIPPH